MGKIITISQALFEGMMSSTDEYCHNVSEAGPWPGGCRCSKDADCIIGKHFRPMSISVN